jgi:hypothetical protein
MKLFTSFVERVKGWKTKSQRTPKPSPELALLTPSSQPFGSCLA